MPPEDVVEQISVTECAGCRVLIPADESEQPVTHLESCTCRPENGGSGYVDLQVRETYYTVNGRRVDDEIGRAAMIAQEARWIAAAEQQRANA